MRIKSLLFIGIILICSHKLIAQNNKKPNIIFILADDLGYGDLSCYGNTEIQTPNLDKLSRQGIRFTDYHSNGAVCTPTRAALLTGKYQQRTGLSEVAAVVWHHNVGLNPKELTFAEILKSAGYKTALFGKWHLGVETKFNPSRQGFDEFIGFTAGNVDYHSHLNLKKELDWWTNEQIKDERGYQTELITQHALRYIKNVDSETPFCLYLPFGAPHTPNQGPYSKVQRTPSHLSKEQGIQFADSINATIPTPPKGYKLAEDKNQQFRQISIEMVEYLDTSIGKIILELKQRDLLDNTLVIFTSDNGPRKMLSSGGFKGGKGSLYEGGHRVPFIAFWPSKIKEGRVSDEVILSMDFLPTFASLAGTELPENNNIDGVDLSSHILNDQALPERKVFWAKSKGRVIRDEDWKLIKYENGSIELFNLADDIKETTNLSEKHPELVNQLSVQLDNWYTDVTFGVDQIINHQKLRELKQKQNKKERNKNLKINKGK